jgi:hypothetical protein
MQYCDDVSCIQQQMTAAIFYMNIKLLFILVNTITPLWDNITLWIVIWILVNFVCHNP